MIASNRIDPKFYPKFMAKVKVNENGCWIWQGWCYPNGYGQFKENHNFKAHRWIYEYFNGPIAEGLVIDHVCRVRRCVNPNPDHLEAVTQRENLLRGTQSNMVACATGLCKNGHLLSPCKKYPGHGSSRCKVCDRERKRTSRLQAQVEPSQSFQLILNN